MDYFGYYNPSLLAKRLYENNLAKNKKIINVINDALIDLRNIVNKNKIPKNENHGKVTDIVEKIIDFNKKEKYKRLKI